MLSTGSIYINLKQKICRYYQSWSFISHDKVILDSNVTRVRSMFCTYMKSWNVFMNLSLSMFNFFIKLQNIRYLKFVKLCNANVTILTANFRLHKTFLNFTFFSFICATVNNRSVMVICQQTS